MSEENKDNALLIEELNRLRRRVRELEEAEAERKKAEEAMRRSGAQLQLVCDNINAAIVVTDNEGRIAYVNRRCEELSGYSREEMIGRSHLDFTLPEEIPATLERIEKLLKGELGRYSIEKRWRRKDGTLLWTEMSVASVRNAEGSVEHLTAILIDITARRQAEEALRNSQQLFEAFMTHFPGCTFIKDVQGRYVYANANLEKLASPEPLLGKTDREIFPVDLAEEYRLNDQIVMSKGINLETFEPGLHEDGLHTYLSTKFPIFQEDRPAMIGGIAVDITDHLRAEQALKRSETRYRELVQSANSIILRMDTRGRITFFNDFARRFFGFSDDEIMGRSVIGTIVPETESSGRDLKAMIGDLLKHPEHYATNENENMRRNGERVWITWTNKPIRDDTGHVAEILSVGNDITDRKQTEEALRKSEQRLRESEQYLARLLETLKAGVLIVDPASHRIMDVNRHAAKLIGIEKEDLLGQHCHEFICPARWGECPVTDLGLEISNMERTLLTANGQQMPVLKSVTTAERDGKEYLVECFTDIRFLKKLLKEQEIDIGLSKKILTLVNGMVPRYTDLPGGKMLFTEAISLSCHQEGGDHYFIRTLTPDEGYPEGRTLISLKDQSGHQVGSVLRSILTDLVHQSVIHIRKSLSVEEMTSALNQSLLSSDLLQEDDFLTAVNCEIDHEQLMLRYVSCGHPRFLVIREGGILVLPRIKGGDGANLPLAVLERDYSAGEFQLCPGDKLLFYTDGLLEATVPDEAAQTGNETISVRELKQILARLISENGPMPIREIMRNLLREIATLSGVPIDPSGTNCSKDDITLLGLEIENQSDFTEEIWHPRDIKDLQNKINRFCEVHLRQWKEQGFSSPLRLRLCFEEAVVNAWKHGHHMSPFQPIRVRYRYGNDFHLEIIDRGRGFRVCDVPDPVETVNQLREYGRGVFMIRNYASRARWKAGGRHLIMAFKKEPNTIEKDCIRLADTCLSLWNNKDRG